CRRSGNLTEHSSIPIPVCVEQFEENFPTPMNDFSELENELKKLRPAQPSPMLIERVGEALENCPASASGAKRRRWRFTEWWRQEASGIDGRLVGARHRE